MFYIVAFAFLFLILLEFDYKSLAYVLYFGAWTNHVIGNGVYYAIVGLYLFVGLTKIVFFEQKSELKKMWPFALGILPFIIYACIPPVGGNSGSIIFFSLLLFICIFAAEKIGFKNIVYWFCCGLIVSSIIGLFVNNIAFLDRNIIDYYSSDLRRFSGITTNPNIYYRHILCALCGVCVLSLKGNIKLWQFGVLFATLSIFGFMTLSRGFYLFYAVIVTFYLGLLVIKDRQKSIKPIALMLLMMVLVGAVLYKFTLPAIAWVVKSFDTEMTTYENSSTWDTKQLDPNEKFDPGRFGIWEMNISEWLSSPKAFIFGKGLDSKNIGNITQHNALVFILVKTGLVGFICFIGYFVSLFFTLYKSKKYKFTVAPFLLLLGLVCICIVETSFPTRRFFEFLILFVLSAAVPKVTTTT